MQQGCLWSPPSSITRSERLISGGGNLAREQLITSTFTINQAQEKETPRMLASKTSSPRIHIQEATRWPKGYVPK